MSAQDPGVPVVAGGPPAAGVSGRLLASRPEGRGPGTALAWSLALALHLALLLVLLRVPPGDEGALPFQLVPVAERPIIVVFSPGQAAVRPRARARVPAGAPRARGRAVLRRRATPPMQRAGQVAARTGGAGAEPGTSRVQEAGLTARERLRPGAWDRRLWEAGPATLQANGARRGDGAASEAAASPQTRPAVDSAAVIAEAHRLASLRPPPPKPHKRWGVEKGRLYLAGISVPIPRPAPWGTSSDEMREDDRKAEMRRVFDERVQAIRERKDSEHREKKGQTKP